MSTQLPGGWIRRRRFQSGLNGGRKCWTIDGNSFHDSAGSQVRMVSRVGGSWGAPSLGVFIRPELLISVVVPPLDS